MHKIGLLPFTAWLMSDKRHSWCWHPPHSHPGSADIFSDLQLLQTSCIFSNFYNFFIFYNIFDFYNVSRFCTTLHLLQLVQLLHLVCNLASSLRLALHLLHRKIDALHIRSRYILRSWIWSPDGQIWSDVLRQATFTAYLNKVVDCCWSSITRVLPIILLFDDMHIWGSSHCVIF